MASSNGSMQGLKAKANGLNGHVNGRVTEMSTHLDGALNGVKPNLNSHAVLPRRHTTRRQRGFVARSFNVIARYVKRDVCIFIAFCGRKLTLCFAQTPDILHHLYCPLPLPDKLRSLQ